MNNRMYDFSDGRGEVPAHKHTNPDGSVGGWVAETASVENTCYIDEHAKVFGNARVFGNAKVYGDAEVYGDLSVDTMLYK